MKITSRKSMRWTATVAYALVVLFLSITRAKGPLPFPHFDIIAHFVMYFGLSVFLAWSLAASFPLTPRGVIAIAFVAATLYGIATEIVQIFVPTRGFEFKDIISNASGAISGSTLMVLFRERLHEDDDGMEDSL